MTLPLSNNIDLENYIETSMNVMDEFLNEFFNSGSGFDADITVVDRDLKNPLVKPQILYQPNPIEVIKRGPVDLTGSTIKRGHSKIINWTFSVITDDNIGGSLQLTRYSGHLDFVFRKYGYYLAQRGLRKNTLTGPAQANGDEFYQHLFTLTNELLLTWEVT